jgi:hypothetical protein
MGFIVNHSVQLLEDGREIHTLADADEYRCDKVHYWAKDCPACQRDAALAKIAAAEAALSTEREYASDLRRANKALADAEADARARLAEAGAALKHDERLISDLTAERDELMDGNEGARVYCGNLEERLAASEARCAAAVEALRKIASCESRVKGDVVDVAQCALSSPDLAPWVRLLEAVRAQRKAREDKKTAYLRATKSTVAAVKLADEAAEMAYHHACDETNAAARDVWSGEGGASE